MPTPTTRAPAVTHASCSRLRRQVLAAAGIALVNSIGNLGGFVGPYLVGLMKDATGSTDGGLVTLAAVLAFGAFVATRAAHDPALERAPRPEPRFSRQPRAAGQRVRPVA